MPNKTIPNFSLFVILLPCFSIFLTSCVSDFAGSDAVANAEAKSAFGKPEVIGTIKSAKITESSGLAFSKCQKDVLWTHNDSGGGDFIYALNTKGELLATFEIKDVDTFDLEDIATSRDKSGKCFLYLGDIGNNARKRDEEKIYRIAEPTASKTDAVNLTESADVLTFSYPDIRHDAETLMVHPVSGSIYVISKRVSGAAGVYKLQPEFNQSEPQVATKIADLSVPAIPNGLLTAGDIAADGKHVVICDYFAAYELTIPDNAEDFDAVWKETPHRISLGEREQGEAITYGADENTLYASSENKNSPIIELKRTRPEMEKPGIR